MFCASVSGYRYICFEFITAPMIHDRGSDMIREVLCVLYPCCFCKLLGFFFHAFAGFYGLYLCLVA